MSNQGTKRPNDIATWFSGSANADSEGPKEKKVKTSHADAKETKTSSSSHSDNAMTDEQSVLMVETETKADKADKPFSEASRAFDSEWCKDRAWLYYMDGPADRKGMYCRVCKSTNKAGTWSQRPCRTIRKRAVEEHEKSETHIRSLNTKVQQKTLFNKLLCSGNDEEIFNGLVKKFQMLYWICFEEACFMCTWSPLL
jgi:hypothetical protein